MSILLPLYIYPWPGVWDPLYTAAASYPKVDFTVILNPCNGPCLNSTPEAPYLAEMPKLKTYSNIRTLGYVATNYTDKPIDQILQEIHTWSNYPNSLNDSKLAVEGIFFDEIPGLYDWRKYDYLAEATNEVKNSAGLGQKVVVHNPGTVQDRTWNYFNLSDITVIYEEAFSNWIDKTNFNRLMGYQTETNRTKDHFSIMLHTVPNIADDTIEFMVKELEKMAGWFFFTSVGTQGEYWHSFSGLFEEIVKAVAGG